tara:strand:- start:3665 stop:4507 length:843 start_codon:yes stop_codon:yes gene_type:complete
VALNFPNSPVAGQVYVNHESGFTYEWDGVVWNSITTASTSRIKIVDDISSSFNGALTSFPITSNSAAVTPKNRQSIIVNLGGVIQDPTDDYSISGSTLEFAVPPISGLSFSAIILGSAYDNIITTNTYSEVAGISTTSQYASVAGISTTSQYASVSGISTYASTAGVSTTSGYASTSGISTTSQYASVAGISTVSENLTGTPNIVVGSVTANTVSALSFSGTVPSSSLSGPLPAIDGSQLTGVATNTSFLVTGRSSNTTILLSSGSFSIEGRSGDVTINA